MGPRTEAGETVHAMKYRGEREPYRDAVNRMSQALSDNDAHYHELREIIGGMRFWPAGRIQAAAGSAKNVTMYNCFVSGIIADSFTEPMAFVDKGSIMQRAWEAASTMRMGGGIGYDFSTLRPRGSMIMKLQSQASGPVSFMKIYNEICKTIASAGHRRGAEMGVMRCDHPDILEFIAAKHDNTTLTGFNVSVGITDEFMEALYAKKTFSLKFDGKVYKEIDAEALWETIMRSTWDYAEPGVLFIDTINNLNNLWYCEKIAATNPCGEQPLPPHGACLLGSFNITQYLTRQPIPVTAVNNNGTISFPGWHLDIDQIERDIPAVVRAMDNVVDRSLYPLEAQREEAISKRRMGLGVMGIANALEALGLSYGSPGFLAKQAEVLRRINTAAYKASAMLAKEKGSFPLFHADNYMLSKFVQSEALDDEARDLIRKHGIRNSHLTSIAPTGTISLSADNISSGIEPVFSYSYERDVQTPTGPRHLKIEDYGMKFLGVKGKVSADVTVEEHLGVLVTAQKYVDSAVSKTCNCTGKMSWADFKGIYTGAYDGKCKGATTFNQDGKRMALLKATDDESESAQCRIDMETGRRECG